MRYLERVRILQRLDDLIRRKATGTPVDCANRLDVSRATFFRLLDELKSLDAPICYCRNRESYFYEEDFVFAV